MEEKAGKGESINKKEGNISHLISCVLSSAWRHPLDAPSQLFGHFTDIPDIGERKTTNLARAPQLAWTWRAYLVMKYQEKSENKLLKKEDERKERKKRRKRKRRKERRKKKTMVTCWQKQNNNNNNKTTIPVRRALWLGGSVLGWFGSYLLTTMTKKKSRGIKPLPALWRGRAASRIFF